mmetsp:Transcript_55786/g.165901  ORF Transcript_55786/g.165901 Transcript_55786/m.165901 type:complete len:133 (+) Transcript_55786:93-491(+)
MARVAQVGAAALAVLAGLAAAAAGQTEVSQGSAADAKAAFAAPAAPAPAASLRATAATVLEDLGTAPLRPAPEMAYGARIAFAALIGLPLVLLFGMFVAKSMGGFYPNGVVCFLILLVFGYTMVKSPYSYFA